MKNNDADHIPPHDAALLVDKGRFWNRICYVPRVTTGCGFDGRSGFDIGGHRRGKPNEMIKSETVDRTNFWFAPIALSVGELRPGVIRSASRLRLT